MKVVTTDVDTGEAVDRAMTAEEQAQYTIDMATLFSPQPLDLLTPYNAAIAAMIDAKAQEKGYDSALTLATYRDSTNPQWKLEYTAFFEWRDRVLTYCYQAYASVQSGGRSQPTVDDFVKEVGSTILMTWPTVYVG